MPNLTVKQLCEYLQANFAPDTLVVVNYIDIYRNPHERPLLQESIKSRLKACYFDVSY